MKKKLLLQPKTIYIPARGPRGPIKRRDGRENFASSLCEDLSKDPAEDLLDRISVEAALQDQFVRVSVEGPAGDLVQVPFVAEYGTPGANNAQVKNAQHASCAHNKCRKKGWGEG